MKRFLALLVACLMLATMVVVSSAATYEVTMSASNLTVEDYIDDEEGSGFYPVVVSLDSLPVSTTNADMSESLNAYEIYLKYDATKVKLHSWAGGAIDGGIGYEYKKSGKWVVASYTTDVVEYDEGVIQIVASTTANGATTDKAFGTGEIAEVYFEPVAGATGVVDIEFVLSAVNSSSGTEYKTLMSTKSAVGLLSGVDFDVVNGSINLGGEDLPAEKPETTVVKTFPKRFYADNAITTVGVILEGKDYDNATEVKAGIKTQRDEVNVNTYAPGAIASTTDEDKSYVMVTLGEITETTVFQPTTPTWAFVEIDGTLIEGEKVTENVTSADDAGVGEDYKG